jgi:hypothetical protein
LYTVTSEIALIFYSEALVGEAKPARKITPILNAAKNMAFFLDAVSATGFRLQVYNSSYERVTMLLACNFLI